MAFLADLLRLPTPAQVPGPSDGVRSLDGSKGFFILNPSGDLVKTQTSFEPWTKTMAARGWDGIVGRAPSEGELIKALSTKEIVVYFGHGGAEQYIRSQKIKHLPQCATLLLWGCSSGALKSQGQLDRTGTPWHYILAGCPSLVANLWDVTDRDIDRLSKAVLSDYGLGEEHAPTAGSQPTNVCLALAAARDECKLKYLTGAAPVVYGLPSRLRTD